jgi:hypothetical protein
VSARRNSTDSLLPTLALLLCAGLAGCRHKIAPYTIPLGAQAPLALEDPSSDEPPPVIAVQPPPDFGPLPSVNPSVPVPRKRPIPKEETPPPSPAAGEPAPAQLAIGSLSTGTDATPQIQQQAQDMISSILKRITALPTRVADAQKRQIRQVRHFLDQAQQALNTGDTEGAKNLATKARLLMDDLEKK